MAYVYGPWYPVTYLRNPLPSRTWFFYAIKKVKETNLVTYLMSTNLYQNCVMQIWKLAGFSIKFGIKPNLEKYETIRQHLYGFRFWSMFSSIKNILDVKLYQKYQFELVSTSNKNYSYTSKAFAPRMRSRSHSCRRFHRSDSMAGGHLTSVPPGVSGTPLPSQ